MADACKARGNAALASGDVDGAIQAYTEGLQALDEQNDDVITRSILLSNRSASFARTGRFSEALQDAEACVQVRPDWAKAYGRKGAAYYGLHQLPEAISAYDAGLQLASASAEEKAALSEGRAAAVQQQQQQQQRRNMRAEDVDMPDVANPLLQAFQGDIFSKLASNPQTAPLLSDPEVQEALRAIQSDKTGTKFSEFAQNPKVMTCIAALMGVHIPSREEQIEEQQKRQAQEDEIRRRHQRQADERKKAEAEAAEAEKRAKLSPEQMQALEAKERGNAAYRKRDFNTALSEYSRAIELDPSNAVFLNNRAAVHFEAGDLDSCVADSEKAIGVEQEKPGAERDDGVIARSLARLGSAAVKRGQYQEAVDFFQKSLVNARTAPTLKALQNAERELTRSRRAAQVNPEAATQHKEAGNAAFRDSRLPEAIKAYTEAIRCLPDESDKEVLAKLDAETKHNIAVLYSNRAATYMKMAENYLAGKDCDRAIFLSPEFVKAHTRKGHVHFVLKEYAQALEAYDKALELAAKTEDPALRQAQEQEIRESVSKTVQAIQARDMQQRGGEVDQDTIRAAERDPEIREILGDPVMNQILQDMQTDPTCIKDHMANPLVAGKIQKLVASGILRVG